MAWAHVQSNSQATATAGGTYAQAYAANVTAGSLVWCCVFWGSTTGTCTVSDGTAWTAISTPTTNATQGERGQMFYRENHPGGAITVTATFSGSFANRVLFIHEYSGIDTTSSFDTSNGSTGSSTAPSTSFSTAAANELLVGACFVDQTASAGAGFTGRRNSLGNQSEDKNQVASGSTSVAFTQSPTGGWTCLGAAFKEPAGGGTVTVKQLAALGAG